jgi:hypothetical protein
MKNGSCGRKFLPSRQKLRIDHVQKAQGPNHVETGHFEIRGKFVVPGLQQNTLYFDQSHERENTHVHEGTRHMPSQKHHTIIV